MFYNNNNLPTTTYSKLTTDPDILQRAKNEFTTRAELSYVVTVTYQYTGGYYTQFVFASDNNTNHFMSLIYGNITQTNVPHEIDLLMYSPYIKDGNGGIGTHYNYSILIIFT